MGKASTSKKVARAAGIGGGRTYRRQTPWGYFGVIALIVILGIVGTVASRDRRLNQIHNAGTSQPPAIGTVWNMGYAVYECGKFVPSISDNHNPQGIHASDPGDGIIHIDPTTDNAAGKNATLGVFSSATGMKLNAAELQVPGGKEYLDGDSCEGKPGHVYVMHFAYEGATGQLYNGAKGELPKLDPRDVPLGDQELVTVAFVPADKASSVPAPPTCVTTNLSRLAASSSSSTSTTAAASTTTTTLAPLNCTGPEDTAVTAKS